MQVNIFNDFFSDFGCFKQSVTFYNVESSTVDFVETFSTTTFEADCIVTVPQPNSLNPDTVDWSLKYRKLRCPVFIPNNTFFVHNGVNYIVKADADLGDYDFYNAIAEEYKAQIPGV